MFEFEKLDTYRLAIEFCQDVDGLLKKTSRSEYALSDQLRRAALSIPLNIAEGAGRWHDKEKRQYCFISRGSAFECVPILTLLENKQLISKEEHANSREKLKRIVQMLTKLAQSLDRDRDT